MSRDPDIQVLFRAHLTALQRKDACVKKGMALDAAGDEASAWAALKRAEAYDLKMRRIEAQVRTPRRRLSTRPT